MGNLTDDMTRLRAEVDALQSARGALMQDLARGAKELRTSVLAMRADFAKAHAAMAKEARRSRAAFVTAMSREVSIFLADCRKARSEKARENRESRVSFCAGVRRSVAGMCKEMADDRAGARLAWRGHGVEIPKERPLPKGPRTVVPRAPVAEVKKKRAKVPRSEGTILSTTSAKPRKARTKSAPGGKVPRKPAKKPAKRRKT